MIETSQLLCVVAVVQAVGDVGGRCVGGIVMDFEVGCPSVVDDAHPP